VDDAQLPHDDGGPDEGPAGLDPASVSAERFDRMVVDQLDLLPDDMVDGLDNIVFVTEDRPEDGSLDLLGLYEALADEIHVTLVHEIAHFYGIDDEQLHELGWA
jgi:predicted Zn-dependent protease with MMP-like domain